MFEAALPEALDGERLDRVVAMLCDLPRKTAAGLVDAGEVRLDGAVHTRRSTRVLHGQTIAFAVPEAEPAYELGPESDIEFVVVHEDDDVIVIDKPAGLVVHPGAGNTTGTLVHGLLDRYPEIVGVGEDDIRPGIVHRLDRDTSGLLVVARSARAYTALTDALRARTVTRRYRTLVWGHVEEPHGLVDAPMGRSPREPTKMAVVVGGRPARTEYEVERRFDLPVPCTELRCGLQTGRTHQIRVHMQAIGHPVVGDSRYGGARQSLPAPRQFLHAELLAFVHPGSGETLTFESSMPEDLRDVIAGLS
ncbi:RluA family pseudouridine synthase [Actinospongicola halichondriae]|uniref:RluA family pseudouridine synthase n=1 Tax=Actinospongicola halichondriae TaxID=3236844 RepID=UPI003D516B90